MKVLFDTNIVLDVLMDRTPFAAAAVVLFEVAPIGRPVLKAALASKFNEFEDAVVYQAACHSGAQAIVTRNQKDFQGANLPIYSSSELFNILSVRDQLQK